MLAALAAASSASAADIRLGLPIACQPGRDCWVQQYVDHDPSAAVRDHACGQQSYDGHDGTDIRIRDTAATAAVLAAADGVVKAVRDGVADRLMRTEADRAAVGNRECGNGVLIDHGGGWETQYCHLRQGTVAVTPGTAIKAGERLGDVGYSGMAAFPHVHLAVRKDGQDIDPFLPEPGAACGPPSQPPLWTEAAAQALAYQRGAILSGGFAPAPVDLPDLEAGLAPEPGVIPGTDWTALIAYAWVINLEAGDEMIVTLTGPGLADARNRVLVDRPKAQYMLFTGHRRPAAGWPKGHYGARVEVRSGGKLRLERSWDANID